MELTNTSADSTLRKACKAKGIIVGGYTPVPMTREETLLLCFMSTHDGYKNWRIPTCEEMQALPFIDVIWIRDATKNHIEQFCPIVRDSNIEQLDSPAMMTMEDAKMYCFFCNHDGHNDWRLPTLDEAKSGEITVVPNWILEPSAGASKTRQWFTLVRDKTLPKCF